MAKDMWGNKITHDIYGNPLRKEKRALSTNDKHILYDMANHRCKNPYCRKKLESEAEMQIGHKKAYSKGGGTNLKNSVCLCYACNRKQGTDSWENFLKKQAIAKGQAEPKTSKPRNRGKKKKTVRRNNNVNPLGIRFDVPRFEKYKL